MKNLFGFTKDGINNFEKFVIRKIEQDKSDELDELVEQGDTLKKEKLAPLWMTIVMYIAGGIGFLCTVLTFLNKNGGFTASMKNAPYIFYTGIGLLVLALALFLYSSYKNKKAYKDDEVNDYLKVVDEKVHECLTELDVPQFYKKIDVLFSIEKQNKKDEKVNAKIAGMYNYVNQETNVFAENNKLCFADNTMVVSIPFDSIVRIEEIKKNTFLPQWNKSEPLKKYKEYKVKANQYGIIAKTLYKFYLNVDGEEYYFIVPNYDFEEMINIIGKENLGFKLEYNPVEKQ